MGFDRVFFLITDAEGLQEGLAPVPDVELSDREKARMILEAHKALINLNEKNKDVFKNVVDALEEELEDFEE